MVFTSTQSQSPIKTVYSGSRLFVLFIVFLLSGLRMSAQLTVTTAIIKNACTNDGSLSATVTGGVPPYHYLWTEYPNKPVGTTATVTGLVSDYYTVRVSDAAGDTAYQYRYLNSTFTYSATATPSHCPSNDGAVSVTVSNTVGPYTYSWSTGQVFTGMNSNTSTLSNLAGGAYSCYVTDGLGCISSISNDSAIYVQSITNMSGVVTATPSDCWVNNGTAAVAIANGVAPYTYSWTYYPYAGPSVTETTPVANNIPPNSWVYVQVIDSRGCQTGASAGVNPSATTMTSTVSATASSCSDGTATVNLVNGVAPFVYYWSLSDGIHPPIVETTPVATHLPPAASGTLLVTDSRGCKTQNTVYINAGPNIIQSSDVITNANCPQADGVIALTVWGGTAPYTYSWSNGATTQTNSNLTMGSYSVIITDASGCVASYTKNVFSNPVLSGQISATSTNCANNSGTASISIQGGTPPYSYLWGNGKSGSTITGLARGYYGVTVTDVNGCQMDQDWVFVDMPASCLTQVYGTVYGDLNGNCVVNPSDYPLPNTIIDGGNNNYTMTDYAGNYLLEYLNPGPEVVTHTPGPGWSTVCPNSTGTYSINITTPSVISGKNFYDKPFSISNDLAVSIASGSVRPGGDIYYYLEVHNNGTSYMNGTVSLKHDPQLTYTLSYPSATSYNVTTATATFDFQNLGPLQIRIYQIVCHLPTTVPVGVTLGAFANVLPVIGDNYPADNQDNTSTVVVGSYDPNGKQVLPVGTGAQGYISQSDAVLKYTIEFQNTGSDSARVVAIQDTLDPSLDITSLRLTAHSHSVRMTLSYPRVLTFTFDKIGLPAKIQNEGGSKGLVSYTIHQLPNLAPGTVIRNKAGIYFDYNVPVITNSTINTITTFTGIENYALTNGMVSIFPNPFSGKALLKINESLGFDEGILRLYDIGGRLMESQEITQHETWIQANTLDAGVYFYRLENQGKELIGQGKLVILKN